MSRKYHNKAWLESKYEDEGLQQSEIAEMCGVSQSTISEWMSRHGIKTADKSEAASGVRGADLSDEDLKSQLEDLYWDKDMNTYQIADIFDVSQSTVHNWMKRFDIELRKASYDRLPHFSTDRRGYEYVQHSHDGSNWSVPVHKLVVVAEEGVDAVQGKITHHKNGVKWDNRPENLELMTRAEHMRVHKERGDIPRGVDT